MLVGHVAAGFIARGAAPQTSLGTLVFSSLLADCLTAAFLLLGLEHWRIVPGERGIRGIDQYDIALSHSLAAMVLWGALFASIYWVLRRYRQGAWAVFIVAISHWVLDVVSHLPDMPLAPGLDSRFGLGLWTSLPATLAVEGSLWAVALFVYSRATAGGTRSAVFGFWAVAAVLTAIWVSNFFAPPPSASASATDGAPAGLVFFSLVVGWSYWVNRVRTPRKRT
jgi:hypothetical protein